MTDVRRLTAAVARGDPGAFASLYEAWFDRCYALARARTGRDESFCLDVVQECMLRVVKKMVPLESDAALAAWMLRAVDTTAIDLLRAETRRGRRERHVADTRSERSSVPDPAATLEEQERHQWLTEKIAELPPSDRALMTARYVDGRTLDEAGSLAGISGDAAHGKIRRFVNRMRQLAQEVFHDRR